MPRSTRNLVRLQIQKAAESQDDCLSHLQSAEEMCEGRSAPVNKYMPQLVAMIDAVKKVLLAFRGEL